MYSVTSVLGTEASEGLAADRNRRVLGMNTSMIEHNGIYMYF
jgi:hypothetical protein